MVAPRHLQSVEAELSLQLLDVRSAFVDADEQNSTVFQLPDVSTITSFIHLSV